MIRIPASIFVASAPVDLRLSFDRLGGIVRTALGREPQGDVAFVFHNRACTHVKILWHDGGGYCVLYTLQAARPPDVPAADGRPR